MRYLLSARVRPDRRQELLEAIEQGRFGEGFPYGDLGETLCRGRVDESGTIRWSSSVIAASSWAWRWTRRSATSWSI